MSAAGNRKTLIGYKVKTMIQLDEKMLRQLQMIQMEMLVEVDRICRKCKINSHLDVGWAAKKKLNHVP